MSDGEAARGGDGPAGGGEGGKDRSPRRWFVRRGWGGVAAMAAACALAAATLIPLSRDAGSAIAGPDRGAGVSRAVPATVDDCESPEASLPASSDSGPAIEAIKKRGHLVVGVDQNSYRWGYRNPETDTLTGFDIDLARAIARNLFGTPKAVVFRAVPTNQRIPALNNGTVDIVVRTMTINCERSRQVAFSTAYFQAGQQILAPKQSAVTGWNSTLRGKRVCSAEGSTAYDELRKNTFGAVFRDQNDGKPADEDVLTVPNQLDCLVRLQQGLVDAVLTDDALAAGQAAQDPAVELKGEGPFTTEYYGVATKLGNDDLVRRINLVLEEYRRGEWQRAYEYWLEDDLPGKSVPPAQYRGR